MAAWSLISKLKEGFAGADGPPRMETCALHLYGKLPIYKDFISSGLTEEGAKEFRDWLGNGFSRRWANDDEYREAEIPLHTFLLPLPGGRRSVTGALWGSHDEGGLRRFPFTLFSVVPQGKAIADPLVALSYLEVFEERATQIRRTYAAGRTLASFYEAYRGAKIEVPVKRPAKIAEGVEKEIRDVTLGDFAESLLGEGAAASWPKFLARLRAACDAPPGEGAGAVRVPVGNLLPATAQLQLWLAWLEAEGAFGRRAPSGVLVCRAGGRSRAVLFFRELRAEDFLLLHPERSDHEFVEEAVPARGEAAPEGPGDVEAPEAGKRPRGWDRPLAGFLRPEGRET
ncbi:MAG TPA: type VI secretion system-associated protein TagF [Thermoanaerobaculia bacterium]|nr:type VI secretion system-associated protein TagF [Thermoanaerobaculia bacterium]